MSFDLGPLARAREDPPRRARRNRAALPPASGSAGFSSGLLALGGKLAVTLERAGEMPPHRLARRSGIALPDRLEDALVLLLNQREVGLLPAHALGQPADHAPRDEVAADELEEARKFRIAGRIRNGAVEREVLVDRRLPGHRGVLDCLQRKADPAQLRARGTLGGDAGRLDLDPETKLHDVEDVGERLHALGLDAKRRVLRGGRDEGAHALARDHQAFCAQRRHGLAHHGAADARGARQRLLGGPPRARLEASALDLLGELLEQAARELALRGERPNPELPRLDVIRHGCMMTDESYQRRIPWFDRSFAANSSAPRWRAPLAAQRSLHRPSRSRSSRQPTSTRSAIRRSKRSCAWATSSRRPPTASTRSRCIRRCSSAARKR